MVNMAVLVCLTAAYSFCAQNELSNLRVCIINSDELMHESTTGKKIVANLEKMGNTLQQEIRKSQEELINMVEELQKKANTMSAKALEKAQEKLEFLQKTLEAKVEEANKKMAQAYKTAQETFNGKAKTAITACIERHGIDILLDIAHDPVHYVSKRAQLLLVTTPDITQEVITILDK